MSKIDVCAVPPTVAEPLPAVSATPGMRLLRNWTLKPRQREQPSPEERAQIAPTAAALNAALTPATPQQIAGLIEELVWHYPNPERPDAARHALAKDWLRDLGHLPEDILGAACTAWRRAPNVFAPTPGQLLALANPIFETRRFWARRAVELAGGTEPARKDQA